MRPRERCQDCKRIARLMRWNALDWWAASLAYFPDQVVAEAHQTFCGIARERVGGLPGRSQDSAPVSPPAALTPAGRPASALGR